MLKCFNRAQQSTDALHLARHGQPDPDGSFPTFFFKREHAPRDACPAIGGMETVSKRPSYRAIGAALGLSHTMARKLHEKQGMPTDLIDSAKSWHALNGHHRATTRGKSKVETPERSFQPESFQVPPALIPGNLPDQGGAHCVLRVVRCRSGLTPQFRQTVP